MSSVKIKPEQLQKTLQKLIEEYGDEAFEICEASAKSAARQGASELKASAPTGGRYARGWSHKILKKGAASYTEVIYNRSDYQLTHLLEKPHDTGNGGHYPKNVDYTGTISRVEDKYTTRFYEEVISKL